MRWSTVLGLGALIGFGVGCSQNGAMRPVERPQAARFIEWDMPAEEAAGAVVELREQQETCRMYMNSSHAGIGVTFTPAGEVSLAQLRSEVRSLAAALRQLDIRPEPNQVATERRPPGEVQAASAARQSAPAEENSTDPAGRVLEAANAASPPFSADDTRASDGAPSSSEGPTGATSLSERTAGAVTTLDDQGRLGTGPTDVEAMSNHQPVDSSHVATLGVRQILELGPEIAVEYVPEGARLTFATRDLSKVAALRARVRWHAADLIPSTAHRGQGCVQMPGPAQPTASLAPLGASPSAD